MSTSRQPRSTAIWATRRDFKGGYVRCAPDDLIRIVAPASAGGRALDISRSEARLLAKRINECLDATVKR